MWHAYMASTSFKNPGVTAKWHSVSQQLVDLTGGTKTVTEKLSRDENGGFFL
jgi:hypothetical protein